MTLKKNFVARPIFPSEVEEYNELAARLGGVFDQPAWARILGGQLNRVAIVDRGGNLRGGFGVYSERHFGMRVIRNPPFCPQTGPFFDFRATNPAAITKEHRDVIDAIAEFFASQGAPLVSISLAPQITDALPFLWRGYKVSPRYTYRVDLRRPPSELLSGMSTERRKNIRKATVDRIEVHALENVEILGQLVTMSFDRSGKSFSNDVMNRILNEYPPGCHSYCLMASLGSQTLAAVYILHDEHTAYYLMGGYSDAAHHGAGALAMWHAILKAKQLGLRIFDFEGSVMPSIERYFRGFGGVLTPALSVQKAWLALEMILKFRYRNRF